MKIIENTEDRLVIEHKPWFLAGITCVMGAVALFAAITVRGIGSVAEHFLVAALGVGALWVAWYFFAFLRITFDRARGHVRHRSIRPMGSRSKHIDLGRVMGARVEANWNGDGARLTRLTLETVDGPIPLEYGYGAADRRELETAINEWLTRPGCQQAEPTSPGLARTG